MMLRRVTIAGHVRAAARGVGRSEGQALSEYVLILGMMVLIIIASLAVMVSPLALVFVRLARRVVLNLSS